MGTLGLILSLAMFATFVYLLFGWAIPTARRHNDGTDTFFEYDFLVDENVEKYHCTRGKCNGRAVWAGDRDTHNNYHDHVDNGLPNPYAHFNPGVL